MEFKDEGIRALFAVILDGEDGKDAHAFAVTTDKERNAQQSTCGVNTAIIRPGKYTTIIGP